MAVEKRGGRRRGGGGEETEEKTDGAEALNWRPDETSGAGGASFQTPLLPRITVRVGRRQTRSPGDTAVCLLIISGQDEPSGAATGDRPLSACV